MKVANYCVLVWPSLPASLVLEMEVSAHMTGFAGLRAQQATHLCKLSLLLPQCLLRARHIVITNQSLLNE